MGECLLKRRPKTGSNWLLNSVITASTGLIYCNFTSIGEPSYSFVNIRKMSVAGTFSVMYTYNIPDGTRSIGVYTESNGWLSQDDRYIHVTEIDSENLAKLELIATRIS